MNRAALIYALKRMGYSVFLVCAITVPLVLAMWLPTYLLQHYGGQNFINAYNYGAPIGLMIMALGYIGCSAYRRKASE